MSFTNYLEDENDKPYFTTNSLAYYYDKMEGFAEKVEGSAKALNLTKEEVEKRITFYIEQNKNELDQRLADWDGKLETFDSSVETLLLEWVDDGTLTHVIDSTLIEQKIAPVAQQLADTAEVGYSNTANFNTVIAAQERLRHLAFGSICRVATLSTVNTLDVNLVVYRSGTTHRSNGKIKGVLVSNLGAPIGEPFMIADPVDYPTGGRGGVPAVGDFRDPNVLQLPDGRILLTFLAAEYSGDNRIDSESYCMIGTWDSTNRNIQWGAPILQFPVRGTFFYGKPFVEGEYIYSATWTDGKLTDSDGNTRGQASRAPLSDPTNFSKLGGIIYNVPHAHYSEPILRPRPGGGYFLQVRYETGGVHHVDRFDSDDLNTWSSAVAIYDGSAHSKGLEMLDDGRYFTGIRYLNSRPGVAILTTVESAATPSQLVLSGIVYSSQSTSDESGYMEFQKIKDGEYLGMFHTEGGETIRCFNFTLSMIMDKRVKEAESIYPMQEVITADKVDPLLFAGRKAMRTHNLLTNPLLHTPFGFTRPLAWTGTPPTISDGTEVDTPGAGYPKINISAGSVTSNVKTPYSRLFAYQPLIAAARIYCKTPNRVRLAVTFGTQKTSAFHSGKGWETLLIVSKGNQYQSIDGSGIATDNITFQFLSSGTGLYNFYVDWTSLGFGETVPEVLNDSAERMMSLVRVDLSAKDNTFTFADLGLRTPAHALTYTVTLLETSFNVLGYFVTKTATGFTITLADGTSWGAGKKAILEIIGS